MSPASLPRPYRPRAIDPSCPNCGHLATCHDGQPCFTRLPGDPPPRCGCTTAAEQIPGWQAFLAHTPRGIHVVSAQPEPQFNDYAGDATHKIGELVGPNLLGEMFEAVSAVYDPEANTTRVGFIVHVATPVT